MKRIRPILLSLVAWLGASALVGGCLQGKFKIHRNPKESSAAAAKTGSEAPQVAAKFTVTDCVDPDVDALAEGVSFTKCDGSVVTGEMKACTSDGQLDCVARGSFYSADTDNIAASKLALGTSILGVNGTKREMKQCRNAARLSVFDINGVITAKKVPIAVTAVPVANTLEFGSAHGLSTNDPVQVMCSGVGTTMPGAGAVSEGSAYYAIVTAANRIQLEASIGGGALGITGFTGCSLTWVVAPIADGVVSEYDTIDDYALGSGATAANSPWGGDYLCSEQNFSLVSGAAPLAPSNTIPTHATQTWNQIWQDTNTGLYLTNALHYGGGTTDWFAAYALCQGLDALATGGSGWRLPTFKELLQLYIDGITTTIPTSFSQFWSASTGAASLRTAIQVNLSTGHTYSTARNVTTGGVICVR